MSRRTGHPDRFVTFLRDHTVITPATILEGREFRTGVTYKIADIPERRVEYKLGQELQFGSSAAARAFVKAIGAEVCRVGRSAPGGET